jgi:Mn-dependent DtxR family transcriptional regulator
MTRRQGQYLAFIRAYTRIDGRAPAEGDMQRYFRVSPPSVHDMLERLGIAGYVSRIPGVARSIRILLPDSEIPELD